MAITDRRGFLKLMSATGAALVLPALFSEISSRVVDQWCW